MKQVMRGIIAGGLVAAAVAAAVVAVIANDPVKPAVSDPSAAQFANVAPVASPHSGSGFERSDDIQVQAKCIMLGGTKDAPSTAAA